MSFFQITNGDSELSKELYKQLKNNHKCYVALIIPQKTKQKIDETEFYECDLTNQRKVKNLAEIIQKDIGSIDILIDNGKIEIGREIDFIERSGSNILSFINVSFLNLF